MKSDACARTRTALACDVEASQSGSGCRPAGSSGCVQVPLRTDAPAGSCSSSGSLRPARVHVAGEAGRGDVGSQEYVAVSHPLPGLLALLPLIPSTLGSASRYARSPGSGWLTAMG